MQTTCPHCQTIFKISDTNLRAADGYVRCGLCKQVFNALEKAPVKNKKAPPAQTKIAGSAETPVKKVTQSNKVEPVKSIPEQGHKVSTTTKQNNLPDSNTPSNEKEKKTSTRHETQGNLVEPPLNRDIPKPVTSNTTATPASTEITQRIKPETLNPNPPVDKTDVPAAKTPTTVIASASQTKNNTKIDEPNIVAHNNLFDGVQSKLIPDEYRIPELHHRHSIWKDLAWSLAILVLTTSLFVEYTWFNHHELIRKPQLRPLVTQFCILANCDTLELRAPNEIEMTTRNIYTHPNIKNALMISGTLINHAPFEQPYPNIRVAFSNVRGEVTASRIFIPEDYLQVSVTSLKPLQPDVSIDFTMEIQDPGKNAMTYEFSFL